MRAGLRLTTILLAAGLMLVPRRRLPRIRPSRRPTTNTPATDAVGPRELQNFSLRATHPRGRADAGRAGAEPRRRRSAAPAATAGSRDRRRVATAPIASAGPRHRQAARRRRETATGGSQPTPTPPDASSAAPAPTASHRPTSAAPPPRRRDEPLAPRAPASRSCRGCWPRSRSRRRRLPVLAPPSARSPCRRPASSTFQRCPKPAVRADAGRLPQPPRRPPPPPPAPPRAEARRSAPSADCRRAAAPVARDRRAAAPLRRRRRPGHDRVRARAVQRGQRPGARGACRSQHVQRRRDAGPGARRLLRQPGRRRASGIDAIPPLQAHRRSTSQVVAPRDSDPGI